MSALTGSVCSDIVTAEIAVTLACELTITGGEGLERDANTGGWIRKFHGNDTTHTLTLNFAYFVGTIDTTGNPNTGASHPNFGFSIVTTGVPAGVVITSNFHDTIDLSGTPSQTKNSVVDVYIAVPDTITEKFNFQVEVVMNTGL